MAVAHAVGSADAARVDAVNVLEATYDAMHAALDGLGLGVDRVLVDGPRFRAYFSPDSRAWLPHRCVPGGDSAHLSVAAASILAKEHRDAFARGRMHAEHPAYGFDVHKGYGTPAHLETLLRLGACPYHRVTFRGVPLW